MERTCKKCGEVKPIKEFVKNNLCKLGISYICRKCENERQTNRRSSNRESYNKKALESNYKRHPHLVERKKLMDAGMKKCSKCGNAFEFKEFKKDRCVCYKCRTGHDRGVGFINRLDNGQFVKYLSDEERKLHKRESINKWRKANPEKRKLIEKKSNAKRKINGKLAEQARKYYYLHPTSESRMRYQKSIKGLIASRKAKRIWRENNPDKEKIKSQRQITSLNGCYVVAKLKRSTGLSAETLRQYPELIELKRTQLKILRLTKNETV